MIRELLVGFAALAASSAGAVTFVVRAEAPGVQTSKADLRSGAGVETFNAIATGTTKDFTSTFGGSAFKGDYKGVNIRAADQFGGAGGNTRYAETSAEDGYTLKFTAAPAGGVTYFGLWWSALDAGNKITFYQAGKEVFSFGATEYTNLLKGSNASVPAGYFGNPNAPFLGNNKNEPYAFINFYSSDAFDKIRFFEAPKKGGFETDNHTVGQWLSLEPVPEPSSWAMLIAGFGLVGAAARRRNRVAVA